MSTSNDEILSRLDAIDRKLDYVVERQRWTEELIEEMTPIARLAMTSTAENLASWEQRGAFAMLAELRTAADHLLTSYSPEDARQLADSLVGILDTVRNVTQSDVLSVANDATEVLQHAEEVEAVGMFGAMRKASKDDEIQRGVGMALEILRKLGRARDAASGPARPARPVASKAPAPRAVAAPAPAPSPAAPETAEVVHWEGHSFDGDGFLIDPAAWTPELATKIATGLAIELSDMHWAVIEWVRADYAVTGASPNVRRVAKGSGVGTQAMYQLFPRTPGKTCAMISGVPKPVGCV